MKHSYNAKLTCEWRNDSGMMTSTHSDQMFDLKADDSGMKWSCFAIKSSRSSWDWNVRTQELYFPHNSWLGVRNHFKEGNTYQNSIKFLCWIALLKIVEVPRWAWICAISFWSRLMLKISEAEMEVDDRGILWSLYTNCPYVSKKRSFDEDKEIWVSALASNNCNKAQLTCVEAFRNSTDLYKAGRE